MEMFIYENGYILGYILIGILFNLFVLVVTAITLSLRFGAVNLTLGLNKTINNGNYIKHTKLGYFIPFYKAMTFIRLIVSTIKGFSLIDTLNYINGNKG